MEGEPVKAKRGCGFWALIIGAIVFVLLWVNWPSDEEMKAIAAKKESDSEQAALTARATAVKVSARDLYQAYDANEAKAQQQYGDRPIEVTGEVDAIDLDISDDPTIRLKTGEMFKSVTLRTSPSVAKAAPNLSKGQQITAICQNVSEVVGSPYLHDCVIVQ